MKSKLKRYRLSLIWLGGNLVLSGKYIWDKVGIRCEPCPPGGPCPPCQTDFMGNFWEYVLIWNVIVLAWWGLSDTRKRYVKGRIN